METEKSNGGAGPRCEAVSWIRFHRLARDLAFRIRDSGFRPDLILAITRGGYPPARIISDYLDIFDLVGIKVEHYHGTRKERLVRIPYPLTIPIDGRRLLLVDDVSDSGDTFEAVMRHLASQGTPAAIRSATLHHKSSSRFTPDYYAEKVSDWHWIVYPWAMVEDLTSLLRRMEPRPETVEQFAAALLRRHDLRLPRQALADVLDLERERAATRTPP